MSSWSVAQSRRLYNIAHWGDGYFDIGENGHLLVRPSGPEGAAVDLQQLVEQLPREGLSLPVLLRFSNILHHRVRTLTEAFDAAMAAHEYAARYTAVYPIKVNQQYRVVTEILRHGGDRVGLEAGSKPELMVVLGMAAPGSLVICNGYKDREYIRLALIGRALGLQVHLVVEKLSELALILDESQRLGVRPLLGIRVRLASVGSGNWQNTGGEKGKFGLSASHLLAAIAQLEAAGALDTLQLLHVHLGSQIANIRDIQRGMREVARYYAELQALGVQLRRVDVGGGLGIDYEGSGSRHDCSVNYSVAEYARTIVHALWEVCRDLALPVPDIITESGRAMTAQHALLITDVVDVEQAPELPPAAPAAEDPQLLHDLWQGLQQLQQRNALETYHEAIHWLAEAQAMYLHGLLSLAQRAQVEAIYFATCRAVLALLQPSKRAHREVIDELHTKLADKYFCNFSLFQSLPDVWGIDQIFPIVPLQRHQEEPTRRGTIQDMTCDSDGQILHYVDSEGIEASLPLHPLREGEAYLIGFFLVGAYQEILGDMHNLFGDTDAVNVVLDERGSWHFEGHQRGDAVDTLLRYVSFDPEQLLRSYRVKVQSAPLDDEQRGRFLEVLAAGLKGYTYLEK